METDRRVGLALVQRGRSLIHPETGGRQGTAGPSDLAGKVAWFLRQLLEGPSDDDAPRE